MREKIITIGYQARKQGKTETDPDPKGTPHAAKSGPWDPRVSPQLAECPGAGPCYDRGFSGLGLRATDGRKPRQVRKEATVVVRFVCRGLPGAWHNCPRGIRIPTPCTR